MRPFPTFRRQDDRPSARRPRAGRRPLVEAHEGRRLHSGSNVHHRYDAAPPVIAAVDIGAPASDATHGGGSGGGAGKVSFNGAQSLQLQNSMQNDNRQFTM
jgi:hypothetical protein